MTARDLHERDDIRNTSDINELGKTGALNN